MWAITLISLWLVFYRADIKVKETSGGKILGLMGGGV